MYKLPHYTNEHDLDMLVKKLEETGKKGCRSDVKYFANSPGSGKTCAVYLLSYGVQKKKVDLLITSI